jgi:D-arabinose 1-dehydrogenase-like Zn-dependent alcohol dehydrogenase
MAPDSTIFPLSVSKENLNIPYMPLIRKGIRIQGSLVAPRHIHNQMLEFAARNDIKPIIQTFPMSESGITKAMAILNDGNMRYRAVLLPEVAKNSDESVKSVI